MAHTFAQIVKKELISKSIARGLIMLGLMIVLVGLVWLTFLKALSWLGCLPGNINIQRENTRVFIPITSMIIVSLLLTVVSNLVSGWIRK